MFSRLLLTRQLKSDTVLPFVEEHELGAGHFGQVYRTVVHPDCHNLPLRNNTVNDPNMSSTIAF